MNQVKKPCLQIVKSLLASMCVSLVFLLLSAFLLTQFEWMAAIAKEIVYGIYFVSGVVGGFFSGKLMQKRRIVWAIMTGMLYCMILMCGFIVNQNLQESSVLFLWGCTTIGAILGGIVS